MALTNPGPVQKYRMYLKKIGGYSDRDKVDPDALQAIHEVRLVMRRVNAASGSSCLGTSVSCYLVLFSIVADGRALLFVGQGCG